MQVVPAAWLFLAAAVLAAAVLQIVGAVGVRGYAKMLWVKEMREEGRVQGLESGGMFLRTELSGAEKVQRSHGGR